MLRSVLCRVPIKIPELPEQSFLLDSDAVLNLMREGKTFQLNNVMNSGGMHTLNMDLARLMSIGYITRETALKYSNNRKELMQYM